MSGKNGIYEKLMVIMDAELERASGIFGPHQSRHEAYAVILEEVEEAREEFIQIEIALKRFWENTKNDTPHFVAKEEIIKRALSAAAELIQVAAMTKKDIRA